MKGLAKCLAPPFPADIPFVKAILLTRPPLDKGLFFLKLPFWQGQGKPFDKDHLLARSRQNLLTRITFWQGNYSVNC